VEDRFATVLGRQEGGRRVDEREKGGWRWKRKSVKPEKGSRHCQQSRDVAKPSRGVEAALHSGFYTL